MYISKVYLWDTPEISCPNHQKVIPRISMSYAVSQDAAVSPWAAPGPQMVSAPRQQMELSKVPLEKCWVVRHQSLRCFSLAICGPGADGRRKGQITRVARTTSKFNSCSKAHQARGPALGWPYGSCGHAEAVRARASPTPILYVGLAA